MKKIAILSIPGLPNGLLPLDSKLYHDYEAILGVIQEVENASDDDVFFKTYVWPAVVRHSRYQWACKIPSAAIPIYYGLYNHDAEFRKKIVNRAMKSITELFKVSNKIYLILHSHGNRIAFDALREMKFKGMIPEGKEIVVLSFAPAYTNVANGLLLSGLAEEDIKDVEGAVKFILNFRVETDFLSGKPPLEHYEVFKPKWYEVGWLGHATVRSREDVMEKLKKALVERI
ncbi:hypothetical protein KJ632_03355 [Patescibacteria group bacterium]|nr:hypothetical protein [Patescibacteria group bacterium]